MPDTRQDTKYAIARYAHTRFSLFAQASRTHARGDTACATGDIPGMYTYVACVVAQASRMRVHTRRVQTMHSYTPTSLAHALSFVHDLYTYTEYAYLLAQATAHAR